MIAPVLVPQVKSNQSARTSALLPVSDLRSFSIPANATQETVLRMTAVIGTRLLRRVIRRLQAGLPAAAVAGDAQESPSDYYPMPGQREFDLYFEQRRFFRIRDVLGLIAFRGLRP